MALSVCVYNSNELSRSLVDSCKNRQNRQTKNTTKNTPSPCFDSVPLAGVTREEKEDRRGRPSHWVERLTLTDSTKRLWIGHVGIVHLTLHAWHATRFEEFPRAFVDVAHFRNDILVDQRTNGIFKQRRLIYTPVTGFASIQTCEVGNIKVSLLHQGHGKLPKFTIVLMKLGKIKVVIFDMLISHFFVHNRDQVVNFPSLVRAFTLGCHDICMPHVNPPHACFFIGSHGATPTECTVQPVVKLHDHALTFFHLALSGDTPAHTRYIFVLLVGLPVPLAAFDLRWITFVFSAPKSNRPVFKTSLLHGGAHIHGLTWKSIV